MRHLDSQSNMLATSYSGIYTMGVDTSRTNFSQNRSTSSETSPLYTNKFYQNPSITFELSRTHINTHAPKNINPHSYRRGLITEAYLSPVLSDTLPERFENAVKRFNTVRGSSLSKRSQSQGSDRPHLLLFVHQTWNTEHLLEYLRNKINPCCAYWVDNTLVLLKVCVWGGGAECTFEHIRTSCVKHVYTLLSFNEWKIAITDVPRCLLVEQCFYDAAMQ